MLTNSEMVSHHAIREKDRPGSNLVGRLVKTMCLEKDHTAGKIDCRL